MTLSSASYWIKTLGLKPHPEGGHYRETYRAEGTIPADALSRKDQGTRPFSTAIYFLLENGQCSKLHRLHSDEMWHFYDGSPLSIHMIDLNGKSHSVVLGKDPNAGQAFQTVVPAGWWFGASVEEAGSYALVGCTVAPGFDFRDFEMAERVSLIQKYPEHRQMIQKLTSVS